MALKNCVVCGKEFIPYRKTHLACSPKCIASRKKSQSRARTARKPVLRVCVICTNTFVSKGNYHACSRECRSALLRMRKLRSLQKTKTKRAMNPIIKICVECSSEFTAKRGEKTCSPACSQSRVNTYQAKRSKTKEERIRKSQWAKSRRGMEYSKEFGKTWRQLPKVKQYQNQWRSLPRYQLWKKQYARLPRVKSRKKLVDRMSAKANSHLSFFLAKMAIAKKLFQTTEEQSMSVTTELTIDLGEHADLAGMTGQQLAEVIQYEMGVTARSMVRMSLAFVLAENMGHDMKSIGSPKLCGIFRRIANGQTVPELPIVFAENRNLVEKFSTLPIDDQKRLVSGESVEVAVLGPDGAAQVLKIDPVNMTREQVSLVFTKDSVRTVEQQVPILKQQLQQRVAEVDPVPSDDAVPVAVVFTASEKNRLTRAATKQKTDLANFIRKAALAAL